MTKKLNNEYEEEMYEKPKRQILNELIDDLIYDLNMACMLLFPIEKDWCKFEEHMDSLRTITRIIYDQNSRNWP